MKTTLVLVAAAAAAEDLTNVIVKYEIEIRTSTLHFTVQQVSNALIIIFPPSLPPSLISLSSTSLSHPHLSLSLSHWVLLSIVHTCASELHCD